jgi:hypothetical protein
MFKKLCLTMTVLCALGPSIPCFAQDEISDNQPVRGALNHRETHIQSKLTEAYNKGLLDSNELAEFQRDFDGILDKENALASAGMNEAGRNGILKELSAFEARLDKQAKLNGQRGSKPSN